MKPVYPAILRLFEEEKGYTVLVPDLPDCVTQSSTLADAILMAKEKYGNKAVRKNLTIPAGLNAFAEKRQVNFSQVLTDTLATLYQQSQ